MEFEIDATFQPVTITQRPSADVLLRTNPGGLSTSQLREYRRVMQQHQRATLLLSMELELNEIRLFFHDRTLRGNTEAIRPHALSVAADLATEEGRRTADLLVREWEPHARSDGYRVCVETPLPDLRGESRDALATFLGAHPPARLGVVVRLTEPPVGGASDMLRWLMPWLHAVECGFPGEAATLAAQLDALAFQGWLVTQS